MRYRGSVLHVDESRLGECCIYQFGKLFCYDAIPQKVVGAHWASWES